MSDFRYWLPCTCGERVAINAKQAGSVVQCDCGQWLSVPPEIELRRLERFDQEADATKDQSDSAAPATPRSLSSSDTGRGSASHQRRRSGRQQAERQLAKGRASLWYWLIPSAVLLVIVAGLVINQMYAPEPLEQLAEERPVTNLVDSEEWILAHTPQLKKLNHSVLNLQLPDYQSRELFHDRVTFVSLTDASPVPSNEAKLLGTSTSDWKVPSDEVDGVLEDVSLWQPLWKHVDYFERAKFYFVNARYESDKRDRIKTEVGFEGLAKDRDQAIWLITAKLGVSWKATPDANDSLQWKIDDWHTKSMKMTRRDQPMFQEVLDAMIPDPDLLERVRRSLHEEMLVKALSGSLEDAPKHHFSQLELSTAEHHPALSVVDIDRDGFDDLYIMARWGKNILLHNQGDGTFQDIAPELGLDLEDRCSGAVFADFDNDGDADLMMGRSMKPSLYLVNEGGSFVDRSTELVDSQLPALVFAVSAADYNSDGLLDVFFATSAVKASVDALSVILPPEDAQGLKREFEKSGNHSVLAKIGPPNVLLVNRGGRFERAPEQDQIAVWRNTNQGTWGDFDDDGDPDLYLSNDFSINTLLRNDGAQGFKDITAESKTADIGFGMGAAWGDYDNDQKMDLYVTNMFSKAGRRITSQLESLDSRFANMARGNSLFHNQSGSFEKVSGLEPPALCVEKAGWSWGGQFVDFDNNGFLDIYALSGYYTAPQEVALDVDL